MNTNISADDNGHLQGRRHSRYKDFVRQIQATMKFYTDNLNATETKPKWVASRPPDKDASPDR